MTKGRLIFAAVMLASLAAWVPLPTPIHSY